MGREVLLRWESLVDQRARGEGRMGRLLHLTTLHACV